MDDALRLIMNHDVFQEATAENTIRVLKQTIDKYGRHSEGRIGKRHTNPDPRCPKKNDKSKTCIRDISSHR